MNTEEGTKITEKGDLIVGKLVMGRVQSVWFPSMSGSFTFTGIPSTPRPFAFTGVSSTLGPFTFTGICRPRFRFPRGVTAP